MTWGNPPAFVPTKPKPGKLITPEQLAGDSEDSHQMALFCWASMNCGQYPQLEWLFSIPNGGSRHIAEATKMVGAGLRKGVPDTLLPCSQKDWNGKIYHGCFIEMKKKEYRKQKDGGLSDDQLKWIPALKAAGYYVAVCYSWTEARDTLIAYLEGKL